MYLSLIYNLPNANRFMQSMKTFTKESECIKIVTMTPPWNLPSIIPESYLLRLSWLCRRKKRRLRTVARGGGGIGAGSWSLRQGCQEPGAHGSGAWTSGTGSARSAHVGHGLVAPTASVSGRHWKNKHARVPSFVKAHEDNDVVYLGPCVSAAFLFLRKKLWNTHTLVERRCVSHY